MKKGLKYFNPTFAAKLIMLEIVLYINISAFYM